MKVITEERLRVIADAQHGKEKWLLENIIRECVEIDTLTVSKLRQMSDAPKDGTLIEVWHKESPDPREAYFCDGFYVIDDYDFCEDELAGWIPKPIYKPESGE